MIKLVSKILKRILPGTLYIWITTVWTKVPEPIINFLFMISLKKVRYSQIKTLKTIQKKDRIKVTFLVIHESVWKYEEVYKLMEEHPRFEPVIIVCPFTYYGDDNMMKEMRRVFNFFNQKGCRVIKTLKDDGSWIDVKDEINPDIVFFTNPWKLTLDAYYIDYYMDTLTCYVPYFFHVTKHLRENYGGRLQNFAWKVFYETETHLEYAKIYSRNKASNVSVTGYPGLDPFFKGFVEKDPWKIQDNRTKRIIWAPHHTISGQDAGLKFSNFEKYAKFFLDLTITYFSEIQIAFKPHPLLKPKLYRAPNWGVEITNAYYDIWDTLDNGFLVEGEYKDLFLASDAIIHDSGSFSVEYLTTLKPAMYTLNDTNQLNNLNEFGKKAVNHHYKAFETNDIEKFIVNNVVKGKDPMKKSRIQFVNEYLVPPNRKSASENIFDNILNSLNN